MVSNKRIEARRVQAALMRAAYADKMYPRLRAAVRSELERQVKEFAASGVASVSKSILKKWTKKLDDAMRSMVLSMASHGWELAGRELKDNTQRATTVAAKSLSVANADNFLTDADFSRIDMWIKTTAQSASATSAKRLSKIFYDGAADQLTPSMIAKNIIESGLTQSDARSKMLAHTGAIWAYNEGAVQRYGEAGVAVVEWLTADDDLKCPFCADMAGKRIKTGEPFFSAGDKLSSDTFTMKIPFGSRGFDVSHPPLHPNCRCTVIPIFEENQ
jgi:hypothetical protein